MDELIGFMNNNIEKSEEFFVNDTEKIKRFKDVVDQMEITGINKSIAKKALEDYLDDIIKRLEDGIK